MIACQIFHKSWSDSTQLVYFSLYIIMTCTKSTLGRVLARYYNWYGMMGRLRAYLRGHGWTEERIMSYDKANRLKVSKDHEGQNPRVLVPSVTAWLKAHGPLPGRAKPSRKRGAGQPAAS